MTKPVSMKFFAAHGPYVKGDIAGFDAVKAAKLKSVARPYDAEAEKNMLDLSLKVDASEVEAMIKEADDQIAAKTAKLDDREAALAVREAALESSADPEPASDAANDKKGKADEPPAQGAVNTAAKK